MVKQELQQETLEQLLIRKLQSKTNEDGDIIYDGISDEKDRTGSNLIQLVQYAVGKQREKPLDYSVFKSQIMKYPLMIPEQQLYSVKTSWIALK